ncbi:MAG: hypothetical protein KDA91_02735 [Planctomycetaceae bacterium]|nr:hypothetical protein [Planctomycetaceae bacterium]
MQIQPRTSPETDRCMDLIRQLGNAVIHDFHLTAELECVVLTGRAMSWYAKQVATSAARRMYPGQKIENRIKVVTVR